MYVTASPTSRRGPTDWAAWRWYFQWIFILLLFADVFACCYPGMTQHIGGVNELFSWEQHTRQYHAYFLIFLKFWSTSCLWNYMVFSFSSSFLEKKVERVMELERIIRDTLTCFIQSHIPAADLRYAEIERSNVIVLAWTLHELSLCTLYWTPSRPL